MKKYFASSVKESKDRCYTIEISKTGFKFNNRVHSIIIAYIDVQALILKHTFDKKDLGFGYREEYQEALLIALFVIWENMLNNSNVDCRAN